MSQRSPGVENLREMKNIRKRAGINNELLWLRVDIVALQKTWLSDWEPFVRENTLLCRGKAEDEIRGYGIGFDLKNSLSMVDILNKISLGNDRSERIY